MRWGAEMIIMIIVDATLDISGMASGGCILAGVDANGVHGVREPFLNSAAHEVRRSSRFCVARTRKSFTNGEVVASLLASALDTYYASRFSSCLQITSPPLSAIRESCAA